MYLIIRLLITAAALWVAVQLVPGITYEGDSLGLVGVALVFGVVNAVVRPILATLTCPLVLLTLGLFLLVLNGLMLWLASAISSSVGINFHVDGFVSAFLGALIVGVVSAVLNVLVGEKKSR
jgi:putative membrane protein